MIRPALVAATPEEFWPTHLDRWFDRHDPAPTPSRRWVTMADLLAADAAQLRSVHARLMASDGASPVAAAKWTSSWFAGMHARTVGYVHATAAAGLLQTADRVRFGLHPGGWADRIDVAGAEVVVASGHPWAGLAGVSVVPDEPTVAALTIAALEAAVQPLLDAVRGLAKVGRRALWTEIADDFASGLLHQVDVAGDPAVVLRVRTALESPVAPWRQRPDLGLATFAGRSVFVGRKAGCCLAYQCTPSPEVAAAVAADAEHQEYLRRFGAEPPEERYCTTCSLRDMADCAARQMFFLERSTPRTA